MSKKIFQPLTFLAAAVLSVVGIAPASNADTFTPQNDPPTVTINTTPQNMQPANPRSTSSYEVNVTIGSQGTAENLSTVTMCFYEASSLASATCADAATDPKRQFKMTWTQSTNSYSVTGTNNYTNSGSTSDYADGSGLTLTINFEFKISNAMAKSGTWNVAIVAEDDQGQDSTEHPDFITGDDTATYIEVLYFGAVTTARSSQDYGNLAYQGLDTAEAINSGSLLANSHSDLSIEATDFTNGGSTINLNEIGGTPSAGEVALDCNAGSTFDVGSSIRVGNTAAPLDYNLFATDYGTGETADTSHVHSCQLTFGGGATTANVQHSNTVTISIGPGF